MPSPSPSPPRDPPPPPRPQYRRLAVPPPPPEGARPPRMAPPAPGMIPPFHGIDHHPRDQFRGIEPTSPIRLPPPGRVPPHLQPLTERNKENLPPAQLRQLENLQENARRATIARRTQLPPGATVPAALAREIGALGMVGRGGDGRQRRALVELEPRPDGRRRWREIERPTEPGENERNVRPRMLSEREERTLGGGREQVVAMPSEHAVRATNNPNLDDLTDMDTGRPVDPPQRVNVPGVIHRVRRLQPPPAPPRR